MNFVKAYCACFSCAVLRGCAVQTNSHRGAGNRGGCGELGASSQRAGRGRQASRSAAGLNVEINSSFPISCTDSREGTKDPTDEQGPAAATHSSSLCLIVSRRAASTMLVRTNGRIGITSYSTETHHRCILWVVFGFWRRLWAELSRPAVPSPCPRPSSVSHILLNGT